VYWRRRLTRLEAAISAALVAVFLAVFLERVLYYMELAERTVMVLTVNNLNSALNVRRAYGMLGGKAMNDASRNPFELAGMSPANFLGEIDAPNLASVERGNWVFDRTRRELIYLPRLRRGFETADPDGAIHFRLELWGHEVSMLVPTSEYAWK
jgi:general secretion pathway protein G